LPGSVSYRSATRSSASSQYTPNCATTVQPQDNNRATQLVNCRRHHTCRTIFTSFVHGTGGVQSLLSVIAVKHTATSIHHRPRNTSARDHQRQVFDALNILPVRRRYQTHHDGVSLKAILVQHRCCDYYSTVQCACYSTRHRVYPILLFLAKHWEWRSFLLVMADQRQMYGPLQ